MSSSSATREYQNVAKRAGLEELTPERALVAELVRRYWILSIECSMLEIQRLGWFLESEIESLQGSKSTQITVRSKPIWIVRQLSRSSPRSLDGSYLRSEVRIPDAQPANVIAFKDAKKDVVAAYIKSETSSYIPALQSVSKRIAGLESPLAMELLATVGLAAQTQGPNGVSGGDQRRSRPSGPAARARASGSFACSMTEC